MLMLLALTMASAPRESAPAPHQPLVAEAPIRLAGLYTPNDCLVAAAEHSATLKPEEAKLTRYVDARTLQYEKGHAVFCAYINHLNRAGQIYKPHKVNDYTWAISLYALDQTTDIWELMGPHNFGFNLIPVGGRGLTTKPVEAAPVAVPQQQHQNQGYVQPSPVKPKEPDPPKLEYARGTWLDATAWDSLNKLTGSTTPIMRADQFVFLTSMQKGRVGFGYYSWLRVKTRKDIEDYVRLDRKGTAEGYKERAAIVVDSGVSPGGRVIIRLHSTFGPWWETRDILEKGLGNSVGRSNPVNNLLEDYKHDAEEIVFTLPCGLPGYAGSDADGKLAESVPIEAAGDQRATLGRNREIQIGYSCMVCHDKAGLIDFTDNARQLVSGDATASLKVLNADRVKAERIKAAYTKNIEKPFKADVAAYAEVLNEASGLTGEEYSAGIRKIVNEYWVDLVTVEKAAFECGVTKEKLVQSLVKYAKYKDDQGLPSNPTIGAFRVNPPVAIRRDHFQEHFGLLMLVLMETYP